MAGLLIILAVAVSAGIAILRPAFFASFWGFMLVCFSGFGFLASFELSAAATGVCSDRFLWQAIYATTGLAGLCMACLPVLIASKKTRALS